MDPFFHTGLSISDSLKTVRKSVLIYETIIKRTDWLVKNILAKKGIMDFPFPLRNFEAGIVPKRNLM